MNSTLLNSKDLLERTGISRATLNNYISWGIVPRPQVLPPGPQDGAAPRIGYFPEDAVKRIADIQRLKKEGWDMKRISQHFGGAQDAALTQGGAANPQPPVSDAPAARAAALPDRLIPGPAASD